MTIKQEIIKEFTVSISLPKLGMAIVMTCVYAATTHTATTERQPQSASMDIVQLAGYILEHRLEGPIPIMLKQTQMLNDIAIKARERHNPKKQNKKIT